MTCVTPSNAESKTPSAVRSEMMAATSRSPGASFRTAGLDATSCAFSWERAVYRTLWPASSAAIKMRKPIKPLAPVMRTVATMALCVVYLSHVASRHQPLIHRVVKSEIPKASLRYAFITNKSPRPSRNGHLAVRKDKL